MTGAPVRVAGGALLLAAAGVEDALRGWLDGYGNLMEAAERQAASVRLEGRGRVAVTPAPTGAVGERWVVRHYHRGGAIARHLGDRYLRVGTPRPFREFRALEVLAARGVPAPAPVGAAVHRTGAFYRGDLVTEWVPDSVDLATLLFATGDDVARPWIEAGPAARSAGRLVRLLHDRGVEHRDLNLKNILLVASGGTPDPRALILDLDRARLHAARVPGRARRAMVARFWRSARKWERRTGRALPAAVRAGFDAGYDEGSGEGQ